MRSAWSYHRRSLITLREAIFKGRRVCQRCGEKFLRRKAEEEGGRSELAESDAEMAETPREVAGGKAAATNLHVGDSQPNSP